MNRSRTVLKWSLFAGAIYFLLIAAAHMLGVKAPMLYVYFDVPSYAYQDRIISFLAFGWAMFLLAGFESVRENRLQIVKYILIAGAGSIAGLGIVNGLTDFGSLSASANPAIFWLETALLFAYLVWLMAFYYQSRKSQE